MDALMALERQANDFTHVPRRANLSSQEFPELYYSQNKPVILTDVITKWPAYRKWDLDYLAHRYGQ